MSVALVLGGFLLLLMIGIPVYLALAIPALVYFVVIDLPVSTSAYAVLQSLSSFPLVAAPLFVLVGALANQFSETERIYAFARRAMSRRPGYSARLNVMVSMIFSGVSGSAVADIGGLGQMEVKAMQREGFTRAYGSALAATTAVVGPIFPPSIPLIIFAAMAQVSSLDALLAGVLPALVIGAVLYVFVILQTPRKLRQGAAAGQAPEAADLGTPFGRLLLDALPLLLLAPAITAAMLLGVMSPSEVGAAAVLYLLALAALRRELTWRGVRRCLVVTYRVTAGILIIIGAAAIFSRVLTLERFPEAVTAWFLQISDDPVVVLLLINALLLVVGMFMETVSALVILTPILVSVAAGIGVHPIHLGVIMVFNLTVGLFTPPMGVGIFTIAQATGESPDRVFREMLPLYLPLLAALLIVTFVPWLSLALI